MGISDDIGALLRNGQQHADDDKLGSADPHMLAAYCFDNVRKQHYLYMLERLGRDVEFTYEHANGTTQTVVDREDVALMMLRDSAFVEHAADRVRQKVGALWNRARDWEARAYALQDIIIRQWRAISEDHRRLIDTAITELETARKLAPEEADLLRRTPLGTPGHTPTLGHSSTVW